MSATAWATIWATIALFIFVGILLYLKTPSMLASYLDKRAERIRNELDEARKLREDARQLLAEYQRKRQEAEKEAEEIVAAAQREAEALLEDARRKTEEYVARRTALAEQKIAQAEQDAVNEVRRNAVEIAVEASRRILAEKVDAKASGELFKSSVEQVISKLH